MNIVLGLSREKIPLKFQREFEGKPFENCEYCRTPLQVEGKRYLVFKYYVGGELRQELAVCHACRTELKNGYSEESKATLKKIYNDAYVAGRLEILFQLNENDNRYLAMTEKCALCQTLKIELSEFFEYAWCEGDELVYYTQPSLICSKCAQSVYNQLSAETKDHKRKFYEKHYGYPPPNVSSNDLTDIANSLWNLL